MCDSFSKRLYSFLDDGKDVENRDVKNVSKFSSRHIMDRGAVKKMQRIQKRTNLGKGKGDNAKLDMGQIALELPAARLS